ncbi:hypothetical protein Tco_1281363 [Tanacetum coccineum]
MHHKEIHLDVGGTSRCYFGMGRLCFELMLLVYKLLLLVLNVNSASTKVTTAQRLRLLKEFLLSEKDKDRRKDKDSKEFDLLKWDQQVVSELVEKL